jgi:hypothetical protein
VIPAEVELSPKPTEATEDLAARELEAYAAYRAVLTDAHRQLDATNQLLILLMALTDGNSESTVDWVEKQVDRIDAQLGKIREVERRLVVAAVTASPAHFLASPEPALDQAAENVVFLRREIEHLRGRTTRTEGR